MVSHPHSQQAPRPARCECGQIAWPIFSEFTGKVLAYSCSLHGYLHHSAIIYEERNLMPEEEQKTMHAVYVRMYGSEWMINSTYQYKDDAFIKAKECYDAFDEVFIGRVKIDAPKP